ncbi:glycerol-3-phosphate acyltransferase 3 [Eurytemora carolleeae]|uniref:glycerol-3-phosphate acyltransferase 3 n=1 Tax=Eurytemora carolleeae TaxID=1294199 RepID=UPI000C77CAF5|nr:glycerol-3-phosphate acyltransferase 3 [Eurytemora carolleeae]|eukprot:XP_023340863.1 glycerol-3-phosphate acyltransferase 3-like [Eurytemora affinis]
MFLETFSFLIFHLLFPPFIFIITLTLVLASFGKSLGIRRLYVRVLLNIFEYARYVSLDRERKLSRFKVGQDSESEDDELESSTTYNQNSTNSDSFVKYNSKDEVPSVPGTGDGEFELDRPGHLDRLVSRHNVISRKDNLILIPDKPAPAPIQEEEEMVGDCMSKMLLNRVVSANTFQREFDLSDVLDYVKTGVAAIIEDEVTQSISNCLKIQFLSKNGKTMFKICISSSYYFAFRYCVLFPGRLAILLVGLIFMVSSSAFCGLVPILSWRRWLYKRFEGFTFVNKKFINLVNISMLATMSVFLFLFLLTLNENIYALKLPSFEHLASAPPRSALTVFRILARSFSAVVNFHSKENRPKTDGICVANHTSPIDVVFMSCDIPYAMILYMGVGMAFIGPLRNSDFKRWLNYQVFTSCFQVLGGALSAVIRYHHTENRPKAGICVANHTSPIDVLVLACDNAYALVGQSHGGVMGICQRSLSRASGHIWFQRSEVKDRAEVARRLKEHVEDPNKLPILIFPEGTCINNTSVMQFKKGSFEVGGVIYPVAIKYDAKFGDAFWNSSQNSMVSYLIKMMTSWAIVCDVWYLPPMTRGENEDAIEFANRVKHEIALKGGLVDLVWDGNLKRQQVKSEWKAAQQQQFSRRIKVE